MQSIVGDDCPDCRVPLIRLGENVPWCGDCEWNLDAFPVDPKDSWFWRRMNLADARAGFRSGRLLAASTEPLPIGGRTHRLLVAGSALILLVGLALIAAGIVVIADFFWFWPIVGGLLPIALGCTLRPWRFAVTEIGLNPVLFLAMAWQLVGGAGFVLLWGLHLTITAKIRAQDRSIELRADQMAARAAGTTATLETFDVLAALPELMRWIQHYAPPGQAATRWRESLRVVHQTMLSRPWTTA